MQKFEPVCGLIFLGGKARRLNGIDKAALSVAGRSCFDHVSSCFKPHISKLYISTHYYFSLDTYGEFPVIRDRSVDGTEGMAGVLLDALQYIAGEEDNRRIDCIVTSTVDTPFLPDDYIENLHALRKGDTPIVSVSRGRTHGLHALWPIACIGKLTNIVRTQREYKIQSIHKILKSKSCIFNDASYPCGSGRANHSGDKNNVDPRQSSGSNEILKQSHPDDMQKPCIDPFFNINAPADLRTIDTFFSDSKSR